VRRAHPGDGAFYLGPVGSIRTARRIAEAIEAAAPLRRCTARLPTAIGQPRAGPCTAAQLGVALCPCAGDVTADEYRAVVERVVAGLTDTPSALLDPLATHMSRLAAGRRFEEAAELRDRAATLVRALERQRRHDALRRAGRLELEVHDQGWAVLDKGILQAAGGQTVDPPLPLPVGTDRAGDPGQPVPCDLVDEIAAVIAWIDARSARVSVRECAGGLAWPADRLPPFEPRHAGSRERPATT
jgi:DNA polymerase-3 subunit epsilon